MNTHITTLPFVVLQPNFVVAEPRTLCIDVSRYQGDFDFVKAKDQGVEMAAIRATVGDYYVDPKLKEFWEGFNSQGILTTVYHVVAPEVGANAQLNWFINKLNENGISPQMPVVMDCELNRGQTQRMITAVIQATSLGATEKFGKHPWIYTRQTWWDYYVLAWSGWKLFPLWPARYMPGLSGPWSDGKCVFRDWTEWSLWQYTSTAKGSDYGASSTFVDLDWFNGTPDHLAAMAGGTVVPVDVLEQPIGQARILVPSLNLRRVPIINMNTQTIAGVINFTGGDLYVFESRLVNGNTWLRIGPQARPLWVAMQYQGNVLMDWVIPPV